MLLLPKKVGANYVRDFRPISILNVVYKIITKILTIRLTSTLDSLIDSSQTGFIAGRYILDGVAATGGYGCLG